MRSQVAITRLRTLTQWLMKAHTALIQIQAQCTHILTMVTTTMAGILEGRRKSITITHTGLTLLTTKVMTTIITRQMTAQELFSW